MSPGFYETSYRGREVGEDDHEFSGDLASLTCLWTIQMEMSSMQLEMQVWSFRGSSFWAEHGTWQSSACS